MLLSLCSLIDYGATGVNTLPQCHVMQHLRMARTCSRCSACQSV
jgi:hypothetical protein